MNPVQEKFTFTVPLTLAAHQLAQRFHAKQSNSGKAKQVYLNTLAICAVKFYLECLGIETELEQSDSWNPIMQTLVNIADLSIKNRGKLECRPVLPEVNSCYVPPEVWENRIGYVPVQFDRALTEATLLGFVPSVVTEEVSLNSLRSLAELPEHLGQFGVSAWVQEPIQLSQWLQNVVETGWETLEALFNPPQTEFAVNFRSIPMRNRTPESPVSGVKRGKLLNLQRLDEQVALLVGLKPATPSEMNISVEVYPIGDRLYLPHDLQLMVLDEQGEAVMQAQARSTKNIQLHFSGESGESFGVKVALGDVSITEAFLI
ncbi:MAG TPA: DUF1822 family protein [Allocoleopsis sp.]